MLNHENCNCAHLCPSGSCIAIWVYDKQECWLLCSTNQSASSKTSQLALDARVGIEIKNATLAGIGKFMSGISMVPLFIPADCAEDTLTFSLSDTTLADALEHAGFVVGSTR